MEDIAGFLGSHPPFDAVDADELARIAAVTETEVTPRGKAVFAQGAGPVESVWVVRSGSVEVIHDGRVLDLLGPGELFGHASMISGLPTGFEARAAEDAARGGAGPLAVGVGLHAGDERVAVARHPLHQPAAAGGQVVHDLGW